MRNPAPWAEILMNGKDDDRMKKYELTNEIKNLPGGVVLYRIRALKDFADVKAGDLGGFVQSERNLDQDGNAWVLPTAQVYGNAWVHGNARVFGNAQVSGQAEIDGNAAVYEDAIVCNYAHVYGDAEVCGNALVCGNAVVYGSPCLSGAAWVSGGDDYAVVKGFGRIHRVSTFFRCSDAVTRVQCGCFYGNLDEFRAKVKKTHGKSRLAREYLMIADLMELHFKREWWSE